MVTTPELEKPVSAQPQPELQIKEVPETPVISETLEKAGVKSQPSQITQAVTDDTTGKPLMTSPATQVVTITIPATPTQLVDWAKGSPSASLTWFATFWLRLIKKALHFGWKVMMKGGSE